jgi:hypothetical protein
MRLLIILPFLLAACAGNPVKQEPFQQYLEAVQQAGQSADAVVGQEYDRELAEYERRFETGEERDITLLLLEPDPNDPYLMSYPGSADGETVAFLAIGNQRDKLRIVNKIATDYAALLVRIVGSETGQVDVQAQAKAINDEVSKYLGNDKSALLSTLFVTAANQYIETKRRDKLGTLLGEGQPAIDGYAHLGSVIAKTAADTLKTSYGRQMRVLAAAKPPRVKDILAANQRLLEQLEMLRQLDQTFAALARNHARLKTAVMAGDTPSFESLREKAKGLKSLYAELKSTSAGEEN